MMRQLASRLTKLEASVPEGRRVAFRIVVHDYAGPSDLAQATCERTLSPNGVLTEIVDFHGRATPTPAEIEQFVARFPVQSA